VDRDHGSCSAFCVIILKFLAVVLNEMPVPNEVVTCRSLVGNTVSLSFDMMIYYVEEYRTLVFKRCPVPVSTGLTTYYSD